MEAAFFSAAHLFRHDRQQGGEEDDAIDAENTSVEDTVSYVERDHSFPNMVLRIREFSFHQVNANLLWPGACIFAKWLYSHHRLLQGQRVLEIGSGTGALAIFLKKACLLDITTSDYADNQIESNIAHNCKLNGTTPLPHIKHTWGETFPVSKPRWSLIIASDILLYTKQYENLIKSIKYLIENYVTDACRKQVEDLTCDGICLACEEQEETIDMPLEAIKRVGSDLRSSKEDCKDLNCDDLYKATSHFQGSGGQSVLPSRLPEPCFLMSWRRRIPKKDEALFFEGCRRAKLVVHDFGSRVYCISQYQ